MKYIFTFILLIFFNTMYSVSNRQEPIPFYSLTKEFYLDSFLSSLSFLMMTPLQPTCSAYNQIYHPSNVEILKEKLSLLLDEKFTKQHNLQTKFSTTMQHDTHIKNYHLIQRKHLINQYSLKGLINLHQEEKQNISIQAIENNLSFHAYHKKIQNLKNEHNQDLKIFLEKIDQRPKALSERIKNIFL